MRRFMRRVLCHPRLPPYSCRINPVSRKIIINATLHHIPETKITLDVHKKYFHLDTLGHQKKYWVEASYPSHVRVIAKEATAVTDHGILRVRIPITEKSLKRLAAMAPKPEGAPEPKPAAPATAEARARAVLANPVKPRVATVKSHKRKANKKPASKFVSSNDADALVERVVSSELEQRQVRMKASEMRESELVSLLEARNKRREEKEQKRQELRQAAQERVQGRRGRK
eukprot:gnl/Chilomastix_cuspidata/1272.p1 GENE.gnl/Chilomastix_cuspidata/1272~~gnl/Chilomastix_cuspidata/1272.p1  ORF type:complete len:229 (+),score=59.08 gnl/Chilomastix_cuspidata/1272:95-781(+)